MAKIVLDRRGDLRKGVFYRFDVASDDSTDGVEKGDDSIVVSRTPTDDTLRGRGEEPWMYFQGFNGLEDYIETRDCLTDPKHITRTTLRRFAAEAFGGKRVSPIIPQDHPFYFALSPELYQRMRKLMLRGAEIRPLELIDHTTQKKIAGIGAVQFVGRARLRPPRFVDGRNRCPHCGEGVILCEACGHWNPYCTVCRKEVAALKKNHGGKTDSRHSIEEDPWRVLEGQTWDGSDLIQSFGGYRSFASKRFIDWLLRVHAAPFYAEPAWFCVDGMSDEQKRWFDELQTPLEA